MLEAVKSLDYRAWQLEPGVPPVPPNLRPRPVSETMAASCRTANRYKDLTRYQSFVLGVCSIGWMLDTTAQQIS